MNCKQCNRKVGHKMDCQGNFKNETIKTPAILSVKDEKHHVISHTIIDYERIEEILNDIKEILERNHWHHEITVPPSENYFKNSLVMKDFNNNLVKS